MLDQAIQNEEQALARREQPSLELQRGMPDILHPHKPNRELSVSFVSTKHLGGGSFGDVDEVRESSTGAVYARKHIHLNVANPEAVKAVKGAVENEVSVMQKLHHDNIAVVLFYLKDEDSFSIFMLPVAECDLRVFLTKMIEQDYPQAEIGQMYPWFGCLLSALTYAHRMSIKHQDIKPSNVLIKNKIPYLSDFGLAKDFAEQEESTSDGDKVHGTRVYRAPEVKPGQKRGRKADVFSLGCVYSEILTVIQGKSLEAFGVKRQESGSREFRESLDQVESWIADFESRRLDDMARSLIFGMITFDAKQRFDAQHSEDCLRRESAFFYIRH